jgi:CUE domain
LTALQDIFPSIDPAQLQRTLLSCGFNVEMAVEQTLRGMEGEGVSSPAAEQHKTAGKKRSKVRTAKDSTT